MAAASDTDILEYARVAGRVVVTLDADFHAILVVSAMSAPSVIRIRLEGLKGPAIAAILRDVLAEYAPDLADGCMITVKERKTTCHCSGPSTELPVTEVTRIGRKREEIAASVHAPAFKPKRQCC